jgi:hypothetical protein
LRYFCAAATIDAMAVPNKKRGTITPENREEARRLRAIWIRYKPTLTERGWGTQEKFGEQFAIGNQAAVAAFLNARTALSLKAAAGFARGLDCKIADFSPRLAALLDGQPSGVEANQQLGVPAPSSLTTVAGLVRELGRLLDAIPRSARAATAEDLAVLARAPKDPDTLRILVSTLERASALAGPAAQTPEGGAGDMGRAIEMIKDSFPKIADPDVSAAVLIQLDNLLMTAVKRPEAIGIAQQWLRGSARKHQPATGPTNAPHKGREKRRA